jgi:hypothetical protein
MTVQEESILIHINKGFWKNAHGSEIAFQLVGDGWQQASQAQGLIFLVEMGEVWRQAKMQSLGCP